jgi:hypothetical protein
LASGGFDKIAGMPSDRAHELVLLDAETGHFAAYGWGNILFLRWWQGGTGPTLERVAHIRERLDGEHLEGVSVVYLVAASAGLPTPEARAAVGQLLARYRDRRACLAVVFEGEGFWASAQRAAVTNVRMQVADESALDIFSNLQELVAWFPQEHRKRTSVSISSDELRALLERIAGAVQP